jgi:hypothetical protein
VLRLGCFNTFDLFLSTLTNNVLCDVDVNASFNSYPLFDTHNIILCISVPPGTH